MNTLARLIGLEGELVEEQMVGGTPRILRMPVPTERLSARWMQDDDPITLAPTYMVVEFEYEFHVPGDPVMATYRRRKVA